jgi:glycerol uptake facilitator protein
MNMNFFIAEFLGTMFLVLLGDGVVANVLLAKSGMKGAGSIQITLAWGAAVLVPAVIFGPVSGAHFNPALTIALAIGSGDWTNVPIYIIGQMLGAILGAILVWLHFKPHYDIEDNPGTILGTFSTGPSIPNTAANFISEFIGTFVLVFALMNFGYNGSVPGAAQLIVFMLIMSIGMSLGGTTGYAINPARDLGPRIAHAFLPIKNKGDSNWGYAWIPVIAPICGGVVAALLTSAIAWIF